MGLKYSLERLDPAIVSDRFVGYDDKTASLGADGVTREKEDQVWQSYPGLSELASCIEVTAMVDPGLTFERKQSL